MNTIYFSLIRKKKRFTETLNKFVIRAEFYFQLKSFCDVEEFLLSLV